MTHFTSERDTTTVVSLNQADSEATAARLVKLSVPFAVEPCPDDRWEFTFPSEHSRLLPTDGLFIGPVASLVGRSFHDASHPEEADFTVVNWDPEDPDSVDLDNGQWYELDGPEGFLAKLVTGVITETTVLP